jgi:hypothetical protein
VYITIFFCAILFKENTKKIEKEKCKPFISVYGYKYCEFNVQRKRENI